MRNLWFGEPEHETDFEKGFNARKREESFNKNESSEWQSGWWSANSQYRVIESSKKVPVDLNAELTELKAIYEKHLEETIDVLKNRVEDYERMFQNELL